MPLAGPRAPPTLPRTPATLHTNNLKHVDKMQTDAVIDDCLNLQRDRNNSSEICELNQGPVDSVMME
ncbi:hypothetical protein UY3_13580 [Chelonia mydas]|uniref:Uncharacterized protein n=1 Tax=Chelonia mydas TaxID=8469 RepID=M7AV48_CHEMY|nr:hypothetical protein UY3_13580 [Chelonia mydas]